MSKTLRRKLSMRDYIVVKYLCEVANGQPTDLDDDFKCKDNAELGKVEQRYVVIPDDRIEVVMNYLVSLCGGQSYAALLDSIKDKKGV